MGSEESGGLTTEPLPAPPGSVAPAALKPPHHPESPCSWHPRREPAGSSGSHRGEDSEETGSEGGWQDLPALGVSSEGFALFLGSPSSSAVPSFSGFFAGKDLQSSNCFGLCTFQQDPAAIRTPVSKF